MLSLYIKPQFMISSVCCLCLLACQLRNNIKAGNRADTIQKTSPEFSLEGIYEADTASAPSLPACHLRITISRNGEGYDYRIQTGLRDISGPLSVNSEGKQVYITLENLPWAEYEGTVTTSADEIPQRNKDVPVGIEAVWHEGEITIQNHGNSMNYYVKIHECDQKYIFLVRKYQE